MVLFRKISPSLEVPAVFFEHQKFFNFPAFDIFKRFNSYGWALLKSKSNLCPLVAASPVL